MNAGQKLPRDQQQLGLGLVIMLVEMLNSANLEEHSAIHEYQAYSSHFGRNQANLFSQEHHVPMFSATGMLVVASQRGSHNSSLQSQRLKSNVEKGKMRSGRKCNMTCSFCNDIAPGHKIIKSCPKYLQLTSTGKLVQNINGSADLDQLAANLGNPLCYLVEVNRNLSTSD
jgi:hypothetical protein